ncbi:MAG: photosystem II reaction center protein PsbN [Cyanobacteria bacterium P01_C01_bin.89]
MVEASDPAFSVGMVVCTILLGVTAYSIYLSFGPPSAELSDPFEDHED